MKRRQHLVTLRKEKNWFQKDVVLQLKERQSVDITESYYGMIEQGVRTPSLNIALALAQLFEVDIQDIFLNNNPTKSSVSEDVTYTA